jgi:hypothetical protein
MSIYYNTAPNDNPLLCYKNLAIGSTVTASSEAAGFPKENVLNPLTYNSWKPNAQDSYIQFDLGAPKEINYMAIAAHNLGSNSNTISFEWFDTVSNTWQNEITNVAPTEDSTILLIMGTNRTFQTWKLAISGGTPPNVGVVYLGKALEVERKIYGGHTPVNLNQDTKILPQKSETGQFLGKSIISQGAKTDVMFKNLSKNFVYGEYKTFIETAQTQPFFFAWRPGTFADGLVYGWVNKDIRASNNGKAALMDSGFSVEGIL